MFDPTVLTQPGTILLDSARPDPSNRRCWCFTAPNRVLTATTPAEVPDLVTALAEATTAGAYVAGYLSYEGGYSFVDLDPPEQNRGPLAWFGVYEQPSLVAPADVEMGLQTLGEVSPVRDVELAVDRSTYLEDIKAIRRHIRDGDVYQINYTAPVGFRYEGDPRTLYRHLRHRQRVPYAAFLNLGNHHILSCSPELFFRRQGDRVVTRPMKGTIRRGRTLEEDQALREELASDPKNRAENLMIVDLLRNDLSVCCRPGTVEVPELYSTESYETVIQMTSTVEGQLRAGRGLDDIFRALFPCGSITGAPKRRSMRLIRQLESGPRGVYCGAIGMATPDEEAVFSVAIRTVELNGEQGKMGVGSGIVWDSTPQTEYDECLLKAQFLTQHMDSRSSTPQEDFQLIETMRFDGVRIPLLDRHVSRLARSAAYFSFPFDEERFRRRVEATLLGRDMDSLLKVRATLDRWGRIKVTTHPLSSQKEEPWRFTIAEERVDSENPMRYHKTTHRGLYERALDAAQQQGFDEALLLNSDGQVTEGTYTNVFVREGDVLWTPPVECGVLAGVYREYVLESHPQAQERPLTLDDISDAEALYCCNAVRGWCQAELTTDLVAKEGG